MGNHWSKPKPLGDQSQAAPGVAGQSVTANRLPLAPSRLTTAPERLVGRDDELRRLGEAWGDSGTHAVSIVAWGGAGKTSLVAKWAGELATRGL